MQTRYPLISPKTANLFQLNMNIYIIYYFTPKNAPIAEYILLKTSDFASPPQQPHKSPNNAPIAPPPI